MSRGPLAWSSNGPQLQPKDVRSVVFAALKTIAHADLTMHNKFAIPGSVILWERWRRFEQSSGQRQRARTLIGGNFRFEV